MIDPMTPADIAAMQADALAGTQGDWVQDDESYPFNTYSDDATGSIVATVDRFHYTPRPYDEKVANARRIARVPRMETTIIALTETNAAQAAEIERMQKALEFTLQWLECDAFTRAKAVIRAALEGRPK